MNALPQARRVINGRTFSQSWSASQHDPIERYSSPFKALDAIRAAICIAACAGIGALLAQAFGG